MILTTSARYAVMAMSEMAKPSSVGRPISLSEISENQNISLSYLEQIFSKLKNHGLVKSIKGPGGGYILNVLPKEIKIYDIIIASGEKIKMTRCSLEDIGCMKDGSMCVTHNLWDGLNEVIVGYFKSVSLYDICNKKIKDNLVNLPTTYSKKDSLGLCDVGNGG